MERHEIGIQMTDRKQNVWEDYLEENEKLLWQDKPDQRIFLLTLGDKYRLVLAALWFVFFIYFMNESFDDGAFVLFQFFNALPFAVLLIFSVSLFYFTIGRWVVDAYSRRHTVYALTSKHAFIAKSAFGRHMDHFPLSPIMDINIAKGDVGAITFGKQQSLFKHWNKWGVEDGSFTFRGLKEPEKVFALIEKIQRRMEKGMSEHEN